MFAQFPVFQNRRRTVDLMFQFLPIDRCAFKVSKVQFTDGDGKVLQGKAGLGTPLVCRRDPQAMGKTGCLQILIWEPFF